MDIKFVILNIVKQIIFFVLNVYLISYVSEYVGKGKIESLLPKTIQVFLGTLRSWTIDLVTNVAVFVIRLVTGSIIYSSITFQLDEYEYEETGISIKVPEIDYDIPNHRSKRAYLPTAWVGGYLASAVYILMPLVFSVVGLKFLAPAAFDSVVEGLKQWTTFSSGTPNFDFFAGMFNTFRDIVWDRFIIEIAKENILLLVGIIFLLFICLGSHYVDLDSANGRKYTYYVWVGSSILISGLNIVYAIIDYAGYVAISSVINSVGMILLFVLIVGEIIEIVEFSSSRLIGFIKKK